MTTEEFTFLSRDGKTRIHGVMWKPAEQKPKAVLQITHGMVEYIDRYRGFAEYLNGQGYLVVGHDHLGHGDSVTDTSQWGYFAPQGSHVLVEDMHTLRRHVQERYPGTPYFMLGHSMGSFLLRKYLYLHGEGLRGAILMGTGYQPDVAVIFGKALCRCLAKCKGWHYRSGLVQSLAISQNDKPFQKEHTKNSWISRDLEVVRAYNQEPRCSFVFTLNGFYTLFDTIWDINRPAHLKQMPKELPLFLVSGAEDPVGGSGKGVKKVYDTYRALGIKDLSMKLYEKDRHEVLNELDKEQVYEDICHWMETRAIK